MAFNLSLYRNESEPERLEKNLVEVITLTGNLKDKTSIEDPVITVQLDGVPSFNYAYIAEFSRYYFLSEAPICVSANLWELHFHVDVLFTYRQEISNCDALISRQEKSFNLYMNDPEIATTQNSFTHIKKIGSFLRLPRNIIITQ